MVQWWLFCISNLSVFPSIETPALKDSLVIPHRTTFTWIISATFYTAMVSYNMTLFITIVLTNYIWMKQMSSQRECLHCFKSTSPTINAVSWKVVLQDFEVDSLVNKHSIFQTFKFLLFSFDILFQWHYLSWPLSTTGMLSW